MVVPVVPLSISPNWTLLPRGIIPAIDQTIRSATVDGRDQGIGDKQLQTFDVPSAQILMRGDKFTSGIGPIFLIGTASNSTLGTGRHSASVNAVGFWVKKPWTADLRVSNIWSYDGANGRVATNRYIVGWIRKNYLRFARSSERRRRPGSAHHRIKGGGLQLPIPLQRCLLLAGCALVMETLRTPPHHRSPNGCRFGLHQNQ